jgi:hypothetical protein
MTLREIYDLMQGHSEYMGGGSGGAERGTIADLLQMGG